MSITLTIESVAYRGAGVARHDGCVYFVPGTCPGETVLAEVVRDKKNFKEARVIEILERSKSDRLSFPNCRLQTAMGEVHVPGCVYDHVTPAAELRYKQEQLKSFLERQGKIENVDALMRPAFISPKPLHYRNKITLHVGPRGNTLGYYGEDNETIIDIPQCPLANVQINKTLTEIREDREFWNYIRHQGSIILRWTEHDGVVVMPDGPGGEAEQLPPLVETSPLVGSLRVPARGFYQMNPEVGAGLVSYVMELVEAAAPRELIDFYCGVGVFGLSASKLKIKHVTGFDSGRGVIRMANDNARKLGLPARFFCEYTARVAKRALAQMESASRMVVIDPPRAGLEPEVTEGFLEYPVEDIVYVSCAPDTLARDLAQLAPMYDVQSVRLFEMFPRTIHFETVVHLKRSQALSSK